MVVSRHIKVYIFSDLGPGMCVVHSCTVQQTVLPYLHYSVFAQIDIDGSIPIDRDLVGLVLPPHSSAE